MTGATAPTRNRLIGAVHAAKKAAGLDDDTYRDKLQAATGKRSAKDCTDAELRAVLDQLNGASRGVGCTRRRADGAQVGKVTALWWSLYHLGIVADPSDKALAAFVKRQAGVDALPWANPAQLAQIIDALKAWAERDGGVDWSAIRPGQPRDPRLAVAEAQWRRLQQRAIPLPAPTLHAFAFSRARRPLAALLPTDWTPLHKELGALIRGAAAKEAS